MFPHLFSLWGPPGDWGLILYTLKPEALQRPFSCLLINRRQFGLVQLHVLNLVVDLGAELQFGSLGFLLCGGSIIAVFPGFLGGLVSTRGKGFVFSALFRFRKCQVMILM